MKSRILFVLLGFIIMMPFLSCKKEEPANIFVDFGEGKYKEPFRGFLSSHPQWLVATLDWPIIRSLRPDTLVLTKTIEIEFNEDAVRSHSEAIVQFVDDSCKRLEGVKVYCNGLPVGKEGYRMEASTEPQLVEIAYKIDPLKKQCTETGFFIVSGIELDEVNSVKLYSDIPKSVADWTYTQKIGLPLLLWLLWLLMALIIIAIAVLLVWLRLNAIKAIANTGFQKGIRNQLVSKSPRKQKKKKEKKPKKEEEGKRLPFFLPWIGNNYENSMFGKRILVLGESHYCGAGCLDCGSSNHNECFDFTTQRVEDYLGRKYEHEHWMNTYLKFERSLVGYETSPDNSLLIWNSISFYNYLQVAVSGPRVEGTPEQYQDAAESFFKVLEQLQPDVLIVWGERLWKCLPARRRRKKNVVVEGYQVKCGYYDLSNGKQVLAFCVYHPSTGYDWSYWHKVITQFI